MLAALLKRKGHARSPSERCSTDRSLKWRAKWNLSWDAPITRSRVAAIATVTIIVAVAFACLRVEAGNAAFAAAGAALLALPFLLSLRCMLDPCGR